MSLHDNNPSFVNGFQVAWDSVSRGAFKTCPRYYWYSIVQGYRKKSINGFSSSHHLIFGIWMHSARELYYKEKANGASHDDAVEMALDYVLKVTWNKTLGRPWNSGDPNKNRFTLVKSVVWYLDKWGQSDPLETIVDVNGKLAVELNLAIETELNVEGTLTPIMLTGHVDRAVKFNGSNYGTDLKTTKNGLDQFYFRQYSPDDQMSGYNWLLERYFDGQFRGIIIDAAQILVGGTRFMRGATARTSSQISEWFDGFRELVDRAYKYYRNDFYPMNEKACFKCDFREICQKSPQSREAFLQSDYEQRQWNPLHQRGDI